MFISCLLACSFIYLSMAAIILFRISGIHFAEELGEPEYGHGGPLGGVCGWVGIILDWRYIQYDLLLLLFLKVR